MNKDLIVKGDLELEGDLVVHGKLTTNNARYACIDLDKLEEMSIEEMLCADSHALRKLVKTILLKSESIDASP